MAGPETIVRATTTPDRTSRRRFVVASTLGAVPALVAFVWLITNGRADFFQSETLGSFYDAQAKALLHGHWDVPSSAVYIEGFKLGSKTFTYFGLWPSLLRMPVLVWGDAYYGRLTQVSMILAALVGLVGVVALHWRIRTLVRPGRACTRGDLAIAAAVTLMFGCGTVVLFLATRAWVYHEAILWGVAWSLVAYERIIAFVVAPRTSRLVAASTLAALAFLSRPAAGLGPVVALGLVLLGQLLRWLRGRWVQRGAAPQSRRLRLLRGLDWLGTEPETGRRWILGTFVAVLVPAVLYAWVNYSRFGSLFRVPWNRQFLVGLNLEHRRVLDANGGTYFGFKFAPTTLLQYLRPDGIAPNKLIPFVTFPRYKTPIIGDLAFDSLEWSTSIPASMPALTLLGAFGLWAVVKCSFARTRAVSALRVPLLGAAAGVVPVVSICFVANRYLGDWIPLLTLAALTGLVVLLRRREESAHRRATGIVLGVTAVLAVFGLWVNGSLAVVYQRLYNPERDSDRVAMLDLQYDVDDWIGGGPRQATFLDALPTRPAGAGTTAVIGDCAAVYWSDGKQWVSLEGAPAGGWFRFHVTPSDVGERWEPIVSWGHGAEANVVGIRRFPNGLHVGLLMPVRHHKFRWFDYSIPIPPSRDGFELGLHVDQALRRVQATADGRFAAEYANVQNMAHGRFRVGRADTPGVADRFSGTLVPQRERGSLCRRLQRRRGA